MLMRFNVTTANLIWNITSLLFAVIGQKTANAWLFLHRLDLQKARVSAAESSSLAVFSLEVTAKTATTPRGLGGLRRWIEAASITSNGRNVPRSSPLPACWHRGCARPGRPRRFRQ